jgi:hypothetical protein
MNTPKNSNLRVNIYSQTGKLTPFLKQELEAVGAEIAVNKKFNKKHFTGKNVTNLPHYMILDGYSGDWGKIVKFAQPIGVKFVWALPLINSTQKDYQKLLSLVGNLPKDMFCKVVWVGGDVNSFGGNFEIKGDYYLITPQDAASCLRRIMLSFWSKGVEEVTVTDKIPQADLLGKFNPNKKVIFYQGQLRGRLVTPKTNTVARLKDYAPIKKPSSSPKPHKLLPKKLIALGLLLIFILSFPFLLLAGAQGLFWAGGKVLQQNPTQAQKLFSRAYDLSNLSFMLFPLGSTKELSQTALIGKNTALSMEALTSIVAGVLGEEVWDVDKLSDRLSLNLDRVYTLVSFLDNKAQAREDLLSAARLAKNLPVLVGGVMPKTYLVLLQDSSIMRPTGGKIVSFALVTFQNGKLVDTNYFDPQIIDDQIKGFVPAPSPLKNYSKEGNWSFEEANWDPDFALTAEKINWFLEKSMDRSVDGVVAISENLNQVGDKKAYLAQKIEKMKSDAKEDPVAFFLGMLGSIKAKNVQISVWDADSGEIIEEIKNNKVVPQKDLWLGLFEANLGDSSNLEKQNFMHAKLDGEMAKIKVQISLNNVGGVGDYRGYFRLIVPTGVTFSKVNILEEGRVVKTISPEVVGRKNVLEAGVLVEVPKDSHREVVFEYSQPLFIDLNSPGTLNLFWQKQAGEGQIPLNIQVDLTNGRQYRYNTLSEEDFSQKINL